MKLVLVVDHFSEHTGYTENCLPRYLAKLGVEVHIVAPNVKPYFDSPWYAETYERFLGPAVVEPGTTQYEGLPIHRLPHRRRAGYVEALGLVDCIRNLKPDIVQCLSCMSWDILRLAMAKSTLGYRLFTENHMHFSVFRPLNQTMPAYQKAWFFLSRRMIGNFIGRRSEMCISTTREGAEISIRHYGISGEKVVVLELGVDTDRFHPVDSSIDQQNRLSLRESLKLNKDTVLCIYTGRFTEAKNPLFLADAVNLMQREGKPICALFVGEGPQKEAIQARQGCVVRDFVPWSDLPEYYRASDIGVWPKQESMSALDAAACGLPIVLSDSIRVTERVEGNGKTYTEGSVDSLVAILSELQDKQVRMKLGQCGTYKMRTCFSWLQNAKMRLRWYQESLNS